MLAGRLRPSAPTYDALDAEAAEDLLLDGQVHLVRVRPDEVERRAEHLRRQREARARRIVVERERADAARQVAVRIGQREHGRERLPHRERLVVGGRVPLVAGDAAVEDAGAGAHRHAAVAARIPRDAEPRRDVVHVGLDDAAADARRRRGRAGRPARSATPATAAPGTNASLRSVGIGVAGTAGRSGRRGSASRADGCGSRPARTG